MEITSVDKFNIFDIKAIKDKWLIWNNRRAMIFEYLGNFGSSQMYTIIKEANLDYQIKIIKEEGSSAIKELLQTPFLDFGKIQKNINDEFGIIINDDNREEIELNCLSEELIKQFIIDKYIARHYLIINFPQEKELDVEQILFKLFIRAAEKNIHIRILEENDINAYVFNNINYPIKYGQEFNEFNIDKEQQYFEDAVDDKFIIRLIRKLDNSNEQFWLFFKKLINNIEKVFFQAKVDGITTSIWHILNQRMEKGNNYFRIGNNFQGSIILRGMPLEDFNMLKYFFNFLEVGDSVVINLYPPEKHILKELTRELTGLDKIYWAEDVAATNRQWESYMQLIINFNDVSNYLLDKRINQFQLDIGSDFYTQRIDSVMSRGINTMLWMGINLLQNERSFSDLKLRQNLLF